MDLERIKKDLERHERYSQTVYQCPAGRWTIGIGRNVQDKGISYTEAMFLLNNDIRECAFDLQRVFGAQFERLPDHVQNVLINMRFQMGPGGFRGFKKMIAAIKKWDMPLAAQEGLDSKWARKDSPRRAKELMGVLRHGYDTIRM